MSRLFLFSLGLLGGCIPLAYTWPGEVDFEVFEAENLEVVGSNPAEINVLTWNVKYGWGRNDIFFDGWGDGVQISKEAVQATLDRQIALMEELQVDVALTQETDKNSRRSAYVDEVRYILDHSSFNYAAYVPIWRAEYVAQSGLGPTEMGQVVFSKWPIIRNTRVDQPVSESDPGYVRYFAPRRAIQWVEIQLQNTHLTVLNVHPTAYSLDGTKQEHLAQIYEKSKVIEGPLVIGGDFNVIPPGSVNLDRFDDVVAADTIGVTEVVYTKEEMASLNPFYEDYQPLIPLKEYKQPEQSLDPEYDQSYTNTTCSGRVNDQKRFFSHSLSKDVFWNQKLDYLFTTESWSGGSVLQCAGDYGISEQPMELSDHAPVFAVLVMR